jgi:hypothetical protein
MSVAFQLITIKRFSMAWRVIATGPIRDKAAVPRVKNPLT